MLQNNTGIEFVGNGEGGLQASGPIAQALLANGMNINVLRPFFNDKNEPCINAVQNGKPVAKKMHTNAVLRRMNGKLLMMQLCRCKEKDWLVLMTW